jgi:trimeric autotransporter adhesin
MRVHAWISSMIVGSLCVVGLPVRAQERAGAEAVTAAPDNPYTPPACVPGVPFADITCTTGFDPWIEQFGHDGITAGCGGGNYCPGLPVTRDQMAVFVEKAMHGTGTWSPGDLGSQNTGLGAQALLNNSPYARDNTAVGYQALYTQSFAGGSVPYGADNTAVGAYALYSNQPDGGNGGLNGLFNTAVGEEALLNNTTGYDNTGLGFYAGSTNTSGASNTFVGYGADATSGSLFNSTAIGANAIVDTPNKVVIGNPGVGVIGGQVPWTAFSDVRGKKDIAELDLGIDFVLALRPVSYRLKNGNGRTDMGFVAQDIEALLGDSYNILSIGGDADRTLALRYTDLIAPTVKAIQEQQAQITDLAKTIQAQQAQIESRDARIAALENQQEGQQAKIKVLADRLEALESHPAVK